MKAPERFNFCTECNDRVSARCSKHPAAKTVNRFPISYSVDANDRVVLHRSVFMQMLDTMRHPKG